MIPRRIGTSDKYTIRISKLVVIVGGRRIGYTNTPAGCVVPYRGKRYVARPIIYHPTNRWTWRWLWIDTSRRAS